MKPSKEIEAVLTLVEEMRDLGIDHLDSEIISSHHKVCDRTEDAMLLKVYNHAIMERNHYIKILQQEIMKVDQEINVLQEKIFTLYQ